jgi:ABC-2 type transport system ATP-binding protein
MNGQAIEIDGLMKRFAHTEALRGLSLAVPRGSVCGFLGRNGAGKTTTIKILMGMLRADAGTARVLGLDIADPEASVAVRKGIGFVSENKELYPYMTVAEMIRFVRGFFPGWRRDLEERYLKLFDLPAGRRLPKLSKGMNSKLQLLLALCRGAELLILDEPTEGLDPAVVEDVLQAVVTLAGDGETTVFFASHQLTEVEQIADRVCIIEDGAAVLNESLDELRANYRVVQVVFDGPAGAAAFESPGIERADASGRTMSLLVSRGVDGVVEQARARQAVSVDVRPVSLKEIFLGTVRTKS